jgi:hypothetical protein
MLPCSKPFLADKETVKMQLLTTLPRVRSGSTKFYQQEHSYESTVSFYFHTHPRSAETHEEKNEYEMHMVGKKEFTLTARSHLISEANQHWK